MKIILETEYEAEIEKLIKNVFDYTAKKYEIPSKTEISLSFLTEEEIKEVNSSSRNVNEITDVLSFPYLENIKGKKIKLSDYKTDINPVTKCLMLGEINICLKRAKEQAEEYGHGVIRECAYLALHGLLHVLGYDHILEEDRQEMRKAEEEILTELGINR